MARSEKRVKPHYHFIPNCFIYCFFVGIGSELGSSISEVKDNEPVELNMGSFLLTAPDIGQYRSICLVSL